MTMTSTAAPCSPDPADGLFARAQAGDEDAWKQLFDTCYDKVVRVVRRKLNHQLNGRVLRSLYDSTDIASDVWKSLATKNDRFEFDSVDQLMAFLVQAAEQRVIDEYRRMHAQKRREDRKRSINQVDGNLGYEPTAQGATPSQHAQAKEAVKLISSGANPEIEVLLDRKMMGDSNEEAAAYMHWTVRKVQRVLKDLHTAYYTRCRELRTNP